MDDVDGTAVVEDLRVGGTALLLLSVIEVGFLVNPLLVFATAVSDFPVHPQLQ